MLERILVPLDGSSLAESALPHVVAVARAFESQVTLLSVVCSEHDSAGHPVDPVEWRISRAQAEAYLSRVEERLIDAGVKIERCICQGRPAECIVDRARGDGADLIVLSSHGHTGLSSWNISGVVRKIVQRANVSVLIVRAFRPPMPGAIAGLSYRRLLVPLDGSQRAECVLPITNRIAAYHEAQILVAHSIPKPEMPRRGPLSGDEQDLVRRFVELNREVVEGYLHGLRSRLGEGIETRLLVSDDVPFSLHQLAESENVDLVVMSAHGYSGKSKWPYGSVSASFIEYGTAPLLIVQDLSWQEVETTRAELVAEEHKGH